MQIRLKRVRGYVLLGCLAALATASHSDVALAAQTDIAVAMPVAATTPKLVGPAVFAARAATAFLYTIAAVGSKPLMFAATGLPTGLTLASDTGTISGTMPAAGSYPIQLTISNGAGSTKQTFTVISGDTLAQTPPMGWNSYDSFGATVTESETVAAATAQKAQLQAYGWNYVIVDYLWFDSEQTLDSNGRFLPSKSRFPSATGTVGFKPLADQIHAMGLNFGIHIMRGIPRKAVSNNSPIANSNYTASQAGNTNDACPWDTHMWGVNGSSAAGQAWYDALFAQYAAWGIDFVKVDDMLNNQVTPNVYHQAEVDAIRKAIDKSGRSIVLSLSPGPMRTQDSSDLNANASMWRMVNDFWDSNGLSTLADVFNAAGSWQGVNGLGVGHWPDCDMLPLGHIGPRSPVGSKSRSSTLTHNEQVSVMSLWSMMPSPLLFGGNEPSLTSDSTGTYTLSLLTNDEVIGIDQDVAGKKGKRVSQTGSQQVWTKGLSGGRTAVAFFNRGDADVQMSATLTQLGVTAPVTARDVWKRSDLGNVAASLSATVPWRGAALYVLSPPITTPEQPDGGAEGGASAAGSGGVSGTAGDAPISGGAGGSSGSGEVAGSDVVTMPGGVSGSGTTVAGGASSGGATAGAAPTGAGAGAAGVTNPPSSTSGCSCRLDVSPRENGFAWLLAAACVASVARRRRR